MSAVVAMLLVAGVSTTDGAGATPAAAKPPTAISVLAKLTVHAKTPVTGYSRSKFGVAWTDSTSAPGGHNHCDTRDDILRRDLSAKVLVKGSKCVVASGKLADPYTGKTVAFIRGAKTSSKVQIDHVVPLEDAWVTGAKSWSAAARTYIANDPINLLATSGSVNESKGDRDAASWLPPRTSYRCAYVARQVAVKARFHLWVTTAEKAKITSVLHSCPTQRAPTESGMPPVPAPKPTTSTTATRTTPASTAPATTDPAAPSATATAVPSDSAGPPAQYGVHPGAFCSPQGAIGYTDKGTRMVCGLASDARNRWHSD